MNTDVKHEELNHIGYLGKNGKLLKDSVCQRPEYLRNLSYPVVPSYDQGKPPCKECSWLLLASNAELFRKEAAMPAQIFYLNADDDRLPVTRSPWFYYTWMAVAVLVAFFCLYVLI